MGVRDFRIALKARNEMSYHDPVFAVENDLSGLYDEAKALVHRYNTIQKERHSNQTLSAAQIHATAVIHLLYQAVVTNFLEVKDQDFFVRIAKQISLNKENQQVVSFYSSQFPSPALTQQFPTAPFVMEENARGLFIHYVMNENRALQKAARPLLKPRGVRFPPHSELFLTQLIENAKSTQGLGERNDDLFSFLSRPAKIHPDSLLDQISFILTHWGDILPESLRQFALRAIDYIKEEQRPHFDGPGPSKVLSFDRFDLEYEAYSADEHWMPNVVMIAKSTLVWLDQLSKMYGYPITQLHEIPDYELDLMAQRGITALWLIGLWERSPASKRIKHLCGNPEAEASAYSLISYDIAESIGGWSSLEDLRNRCNMRGIRLASDMVPNHTGLDSDWALHRPDLFISMDYPPFPSYTYNGENLSVDPDVDIRIEDHYYDQTDAAVTYRRIDKRTGKTDYIFHGNDGTSMPWNDTAQLDFLNPETREAVMQQILHVARNFQVIRFDAAMTLAKRHIQRLWYPAAGSGGDIPGRSSFGMSDEEFAQAIPVEFWREVVDRIAVEVPDTLLLAEAFWMMEGYFVRTLGMHRVYNSAFMNMLKNQENKKYRDTVKNTISFDPEILKRFVNFMNNPDEDTAIAQFGNGDKYFGVCTLLSTMPGLPMIGHGQIEGFHEKYGMEYSKAYWNEYPDEHFIKEHERRIFPLLKMRFAFSGVDYFEMFDAHDNHSVSESIFAYVNGTENLRALVLYNNQYEMAQGRILHSAQKAVRNSEGSRYGRSISLGDALKLSFEGKRFMIYESFPEGLTYILPSVIVFDEGLWVSLGGYETKIFLHIREVEDINGEYEELYNSLGGRGIKDLEREVQLIRLQPLHKAMENFFSVEMFTTLKGILSGQDVHSKELKKFALLAGEAYARTAALYESLSPSQLDYLPPLKEEVQPKELLDELQSLILCFKKDQNKSFFVTGGNIIEELPLLILTSLMMKMFVSDTTSFDEAGHIYASLMIEHMCKDVCDHFHLHKHEIEELVRKALFLSISFDPLHSALDEQSPSWRRVLEKALENMEFRRSIRYNEHNNTTWFNKEDFQLVTYLIGLGACIQTQGEKRPAIEALMSSWLQAELLSEYKVNLLVHNVN
ncbi:MAG: alpha-amylase family glycosyl hydrolase [Sphaerochaetaceae bacterium]